MSLPVQGMNQFLTSSPPSISHTKQKTSRDECISHMQLVTLRVLSSYFHASSSSRSIYIIRNFSSFPLHFSITTLYHLLHTLCPTALLFQNHRWWEKKMEQQQEKKGCFVSAILEMDSRREMKNSCEKRISLPPSFSRISWIKIQVYKKVRKWFPHELLFHFFGQRREKVPLHVEWTTLSWDVVSHSYFHTWTVHQTVSTSRCILDFEGSSSLEMQSKYIPYSTSLRILHYHDLCVQSLCIQSNTCKTRKRVHATCSYRVRVTIQGRLGKEKTSEQKVKCASSWKMGKGNESNRNR